MAIQLGKELTFIECLASLKEAASKNEELSIRQIFAQLSGKGYATLLILFSLPFCIPITIPGVSTPFGLTLCFLGLRLAFGKKLWWPDWILDKKLSSKTVSKLVDHVTTALNYTKKLLKPRLHIFTQSYLADRIHGIAVFFLGILLSLPLPIPFSNMLAAIPILLIGLGLLEDDGLMIIIGYIFATICFAAFIALFLLGKAQFIKIWNGY